MNRKQRRENGINGSVKTYVLTDFQIAKIKADAANEAAEKAFMAMLGLPVLTLMDEFGFGQKRLERFINRLLTKYECFNEGYITLDEVMRVVKEETGVEILNGGINGK